MQLSPRLQAFLLSISAGALLGFSWPYTGSLTPFVFVGFVPLLWLDYTIEKSGFSIRYFVYTYLAFLLFNFISTWWIYYASLAGMLMAVLFNSLFMALILLAFRFTRKNLGNRAGYAAFVLYWLGFEWLHFNWELSWPWLSMGNAFASHWKWIQWYEYTGVLGGSLWVLAGNLFFFFLLKQFIESKKVTYAYLSATFAWLLLPIVLSYGIYATYSEQEHPVQVLVVQPNIDPYNEKFGSMDDRDQVQKMLLLAEEKMDKQIELLVFPETALPSGYWEDELDSVDLILMHRNFMQRFPGVRILTGMSSFRSYPNGGEIPETARPFNDNSGWYDAYNTAIQLDATDSIDIYHKSQLVLGVEKLPFSWLFKPLESFAINLGGTVGSLGIQEHRTVLEDKLVAPDKRHEKAVLAPVICYESVYGEYCTEYVHAGANLICIITNDGWWDDTPGYKQHFDYARLRAIETRRSIARSANTGTSGFINQRGDAFQQTPWWEEATIKQAVNLNNQTTFYTRYGDYLGRIAAPFSLLLFLWAIAKKFAKQTRG